MKALVLSGAGDVTLTVNATAIERRDAAIAFARVLSSVSEESLEAAVESIRELKGIASEVEESRVAIKRPIDAIAKRIQEIAREFLVDVDAQIERLTRGVNAIQAARAKKAREEAEVAERNRRQAEQAERERIAEAERRQQEAIKANLPPPPPSPPPEIRPITQPVFALPPVAPQPKGLRTKREPRFRVDDRTALANEHPEWVVIEAKVKQILDHVRSIGVFEGEQKIGSGLTVYWEDVAQVRI